MLVRSGARILPADRALQAEFVRSIADGRDQSAWTLGAGDAAAAAVLRLSRLRGDPRGRVMLSVYESRHRRLFSLTDVAGPFGLTPAESNIVQLLAQGNPVERITSLAGITAETARTHIRRIYAKMGVGCREELLFAVQQFRVP